MSDRPVNPFSLAIVILHWNDVAMTQRCLDALDAMSGPALAVWVVDNGSTRGDATILRSQRHDLRLRRAPDNLGFPGGNNLALREVLAGEWTHALLLNNDAFVPPDMLDGWARLVAEQPGVGVACPRLLRGDTGRLEAAGGRFRLWQARCLLRGWDEPDAGQYSGVDAVGFCPGTVMLLSVPMLRQVGLLDEAYFLYCEDADLCLRAAHAGWPLMCDGRLTVRHAGSAAGGGYMNANSFYYNVRNGFRLVRSHGSTLERLAFWLWSHSVFPAGVLAYCLRFRRPDLWRAYWQARRDAGQRRGGPRPA